MAGAAGLYAEFTVALAASVHRNRVGGIGFKIRAAGTAVEHIVGGIVQKRRAKLLGFFGQQFGQICIQGLRLLHFLFSFIDCRVGGGVDDPARLTLFDPLTHGGHITEVQLLAA